MKQVLQKIQTDFGCDYYHILMGQGFFQQDFRSQQVCFEMFFRYLPFKGGYAIFAGLDSLLKMICGYTFPSETLDLLTKSGHFSPEYLSYLSRWKFEGSIYALQEGEIIFPASPIIRVQGNALECHLIESLVLNTINYQSLVATKASRIFGASYNKPFVEMGLRRAYGPNGAFFATRAAYIGGANGTSNVVAAAHLNIPVMGSMSHSWVMSYTTELEAFLTFGRLYPHNQVFLLDTYNTLRQGLPHAVEAFKILKKEGVGTEKSLKAIRIDSGDLDYLSKNIREVLDKQGLEDVKIMASDGIDERILMQLHQTKAPIDIFGVGTQLVSKFNSDFSGVYKLVSVYQDCVWRPKIKISDTPKKTTIAGNKNIVRFYDQEGIALVDYIFLEEEREDLLLKLDNKEEIEMFYPFSPYLKKRIYEYGYYEILLDKMMENGKLLGKTNDNLQEIQEYMKKRLNTLHSGHKRLVNPHTYRVGYSHRLASMTWDALASHSSQA